MVRMGLREANQQFSRAIKAVKGGREVVLTERGKPIAVIRPLQQRAGTEDVLRSLAAAGLVRLPTKTGAVPPWRPRRLRGRPITATLRDEREAR